jgi:hypothetical protein
MSNGITLQINSIPALERLLGGNSDVELEIRRGCAVAFADKHLRGLLNETTGAIKATCDKIQTDADAAIAEAKKQGIAAVAEFAGERITNEFGVMHTSKPRNHWEKGVKSFTLDPLVKNAIANEARVQAQPIMEKAIAEAIAQLMPHIEAAVTRRITENMDAKVSELVRQKIAATLKL